MLDEYVGKNISLIMYSKFISLLFADGVLTANVGKNNYTLHVKNTKMTIQFTVGKVDKIELSNEHAILTSKKGLPSVYITSA